MFKRLQRFSERLAGPGARAAIGTMLIVVGLSQLITFTQEVGEALDARAEELGRLDALLEANRDVLRRAGVPIPGDGWPVDLDVSRETSQDRDQKSDDFSGPHADVLAES